MRFRWTWLVFMLLLALGGCAFQKAIDAGNALVEQRQYRAALAEYERAARLDDDSSEARALIAQVMPYALDEAEADMNAELNRGRYEVAMRHVAYVRRYDRERGERLAATVSALMRTNIEALMAHGKMADAYPLAVRAARLFRRMADLDGVFERLRAHYYAEADRETAAGAFEDALASLDVIEKNEPAMKDTLAPRRAKIRGLWADTVVAKASVAESNEELGGAAALYASAYEIAGREADGDAMRRLVRVLRQDGAFNLVADYDGNARRTSAVAPLALSRFTSIEGVAMGAGEEGASMRVNVYVGAASCAEDYRTSTRSKDYIAGTRQVPNPVYDALTVDIDQETTQVTLLTSKVSAKAGEVARIQSRLDRCEQRRQRPERRDDQGGDRGRDRGEPDRGQREAPNCSAIASELSTAKSELSSLESLLRSSESRLSSLTSQRASTPPSLSEDIIETFTYEVRHHTRTCTVGGTASLEPAWSGAESHGVRGVSSTSDESHAGYPQHGIGQDDLHYPISDGQLIAHADQDVAAALGQLVAAKVGVYYQAMSDRALGLEDEDPVASADMLVAVVAAGRGHLDQAHVRRVNESLRSRFGLQSIDTLRR